VDNDSGGSGLALHVATRLIVTLDQHIGLLSSREIRCSLLRSSCSDRSL
jgi:hypothetical protein